MGAGQEPHAVAVEVVTRFIEQVVNGGRVELIDELWHQDLVWSGGSLGEQHGIEAFRKMLGSGGGWVGLRLTVLGVYGRADTVVVQFTNSGRRAGRLLRVLPFTSRAATWNGVGVYVVRDGKIAQGWFVEDVVAMLRGLGLRGALDLMTRR
ncbi:SnoaL-like domain-containing protein [Kribbella sandramycini]|uniref:Limonene-1,2-epoxide hydrolase n=1 Tax=Kribbella sandramycini TaxID=60450 RepID=A0A7Y4L1R7_9ACTN|nr:nuclear transport factor 2 family protein [Kribbella sandramycini]MBB6566632.1 limonene-1,2-epoxide hydrolase [Kribbella sandramycini]NOL42713.1 SnoaL-like domain-containing protein [Kribbella sandramycini]